MNKKTVNVVAAIIENDNSEILCALRSSKMSLPNFWELPGGKLEENENIKDAIEREIEEELLCKVQYVSVFNTNLHDYGHFMVNLTAVKCRLIRGTPMPAEHEKIIWLKRESLGSLIWAPADIPAISLLMGEESIKAVQL